MEKYNKELFAFLCSYAGDGGGGHLADLKTREGSVKSTGVHNATVMEHCPQGRQGHGPKQLAADTFL